MHTFDRSYSSKLAIYKWTVSQNFTCVFGIESFKYRCTYMQYKNDRFPGQSIDTHFITLCWWCWERQRSVQASKEQWSAMGRSSVAHDPKQRPYDFYHLGGGKESRREGEREGGKILSAWVKPGNRQSWAATTCWWGISNSRKLLPPGVEGQKEEVLIECGSQVTWGGWKHSGPVQWGLEPWRSCHRCHQGRIYGFREGQTYGFSLPPTIQLPLVPSMDELSQKPVDTRS